MSTLGTKVVIDGDSSGFERAAGRAGKSMSAFAGKATSDLRVVAGAFVSLAVFKTLIADAGRAALAIDDFSDRTHTSYEETQRLMHSFKKMGLTAEDAEGALVKLAVSRKKAIESDDEALKTFEKYGVSMDDLNNSTLSNYDLMLKIGTALKGMKVNPNMMTDMVEMFGKSGAKLINSIKDAAEKNQISLISDDDIKKLDEYEKAFQRIKEKSQNVVVKGAVGFSRMAEKAWDVWTSSTERDRIRKNKKAFNDYSAAHPEESESTDAASSAYRTAEFFGTREESEAAIQSQANTSYMKHGRADAVKFFGKERADKVEAGIIEQARQRDENRENAGKKPDPVAENKRKSTTEKDPAVDAAIDAALKRLGKHNEIGDSKLGAMNIDEAQRANLGTGARAYDPMIQAQHDNTKALHALTGAIITMKTPKEVFNTDTAWT